MNSFFVIVPKSHSDPSSKTNYNGLYPDNLIQASFNFAESKEQETMCLQKILSCDHPTYSLFLGYTCKRFTQGPHVTINYTWLYLILLFMGILLNTIYSKKKDGKFNYG